MVYGYPLTTVYMTILIVAGLLTLLYVFFADIVDGVAEGIPFFDPAIIFPFITITAAIGYVFEAFTSWQHGIILSLAIIGSSLFTASIYYLLFVPLRRSDVSLAYTDASLEGQIARVLTPIPIDGYGEILIESVSGTISKRACSYHNDSIPFDARVLIIDMKDGTAYVVEQKDTTAFFDT